MSCCGERRKTEPVILGGREAPPPRPLPPVRAAVPFAYTGPTRLLAVGPVTRRQYRFEGTGAIVDVDARDAPAFAAIPHLRRGQPAS